MDPAPFKTESIEVAAEELLKGNLVAIPTETVYGLAADATNPKAVARVFEMKGRPQDHPLIIHCCSAEKAFNCCQGVTDSARRLAQEFWPGPLTMVLPRADTVAPQITGGQDSVAVRVPSHPVTLELLKLVDRPVVAPSANRFGKVSPTIAEHVMDEFAGENLFVLDGGPCNIGIESTIVDCRTDQNVQVLRPGKITDREISEILGVGFSAKTSGPMDSVRVSGTLPSHYSPNARVVLLESENVLGWLERNRECTKTLLVTSSEFSNASPIESIKLLTTENVERFAQDLYRILRDADRQGFETIAIELPVAEGIGNAIRDRLVRAAAEK